MLSVVGWCCELRCCRTLRWQITDPGHRLTSFVEQLRGLGIEPPITPYELRHTAISRQADAGRSAWEIADWAETSEAMISRTYRHRLRRVANLTPVDD